MSDMNVSRFAALASETPDPTAETVEGDQYGIVDTPITETNKEEVKMKDEILADVTDVVDEFSKRTYVQDPADAPPGVDLQEGPQGGLWYDTGRGESNKPEDEESPRQEESEESDEEPNYTPNPSTDIPRFLESDETTEMIETTNSGPFEGFTVQRNLEPYDYWGEDAWTVGITSIHISADEGVSKNDVTEFYEKWSEVLKDEPGLRIGGYHFEDGETISIDLSAMVSDQEEAEELGASLKQESIFHPKKAAESDFEEGSVKTYEGDDVSESGIETPEDVRQALSNIDSLSKKIRQALQNAFSNIMKENTSNMDQKYESENGRVLSRKQIGMAVWKEGKEVVSTDDGLVFDGELYTPIEE